MVSETAAVEALEQLGLTEYESRCFVALTRIGQGTAKDISQVSDVPRSRVYDTVDRLHRRGLVDIQQSEPRKFRAVSKEDAFSKLQDEYSTHIEVADKALEDIETVETQEDKGVWAIASPDYVSDRIVDLLDSAEERAHIIIADETTLNRVTLDRMEAASDRGVQVIVEVPSDDVRDRVHDAVPDAHIVVTSSLQESEMVVNKWPGQLILVDQQAVLSSGVEDSDLPGVKTETAMWTHGRDHGFAAWMPELLHDRVDDTALSD